MVNCMLPIKNDCPEEVLEWSKLLALRRVSDSSLAIGSSRKACWLHGLSTVSCGRGEAEFKIILYNMNQVELATFPVRNVGIICIYKPYNQSSAVSIVIYGERHSMQAVLRMQIFSLVSGIKPEFFEPPFGSSSTPSKASNLLPSPSYQVTP